MVILLVRVENTESLPLNEFFDFNGKCYAISRPRDVQEENAIDFADFFEASVKTSKLEGSAVVFVEADGVDGRVLGWYKEAVISKKIIRPSLFLEGNIIASASDVVLLPKNSDKFSVSLSDSRKLYDVVEFEDERFDILYAMMDSYSGDNAFMRYPYVEANLIGSAIKSIEACNEACEYYASRILNNSCNSIQEIKLLEKYATKLTEMDSKSADGYYYLAMAQCQLGFAKKGMRAIEKALKLEPGASDILAQKGIILCSMGYNEAAADCFGEAYERSHNEQYLLLKGRAYLRADEIDKGYACLKAIEDSAILEEAGIRINEIERKWSFLDIGKTIFRGRH